MLETPPVPSRSDSELSHFPSVQSMDAYAPLLERTKLPQPSFQKQAVISIFEKLRSAPPYIGLDSDAGRDAVTQCISSSSPAVVDQSIRELCLLVKESKFDVSRGLMELQSTLEACDSRFVNVFVKAIGFLVRLGFQRKLFQFTSPEAHPFVKVLLCRTDVQSELVQQVLIFVVQYKHLGMGEVCEFLRPFVNYSIIGMSSLTILSSFVRNLFLSLASMCCSFPREALPVIKLLMGCFKYFTCNNAEDLTHIFYLMEYIADAFIVVLRHLVEEQLLVHEAQLSGVELLEVNFSLHPHLFKFHGGGECMFEVSRRLLVVQKEIGLSYIPELSAVIQSLYFCLMKSQLEHLQLSILKLLVFILKWKSENEYVNGLHELNQEILFVFPVINLMSSSSELVKEAATELLIMFRNFFVKMLAAPNNEVIVQERFPCISTPGSITFRLLQHLWFQDRASVSNSFFLHWASSDEHNFNEKQTSDRTWTSSIIGYSRKLLERKNSSVSISKSEEMHFHEMPSLVGAIASVLVVHQTLGNTAVDLLAVIGTMDPKLGVPLLLVILFYNNIFCGQYGEVNFHEVLLKLLGMLPSLSLHPAMMPLIVQTILPMLQSDAKPVLQGTAIRLLCKTWEINDRVFGSLQGALLPKGFTQFVHERNISISMAVSIRDVCRRNPDRGVDLILSVSACIESKDLIIQALGFQSLAHLCEADVIDFYTAWDVISKHAQNYSTNPVVAEGICLLLKWGAMDAEVYPDMAMNVLGILWEVGTSRHPRDGSLWKKARTSAFEALTQYEVPHIQQSLPDFRAKSLEILIFETEAEVLEAIERLEVKMIKYEHMTRRRLVKEKKISVSKIEKLLDVFPKVIGISGNNSKERELPGAALFSVAFGAKDVNNQGNQNSQVYKDVQRKYENALVEIAASLQLSRNILIAHLSLQSWKPFIQRWMRAQILLVDVKSSSSTLVDKTFKVANDILKCMRRIAENSIPRSAENIALAVGALCMVLPPSAHAVKSTASKFLLNWVSQVEHEYRQWSAAISLGVISSCLHVTDHKQKFQNINALLEIASISKSTLVKGACGVGLGFSCQDLLTRFEVEDDPHMDKETYKIQETVLLGKIITTLSQLIIPYAQSSSNSLRRLSAYFSRGTSNTDLGISADSSNENSEDSEEDTWGVAGLVLGLGSSISAVYRAGYIDAVLEIKKLIESWIPHVNTLFQNSAISSREKSELVLSVGSCLALPIVVAFCQRVELIDGTELDHLVRGCRELIYELLSVKKSGSFYQSLLMVSCVGLGSLLACILNEGMHAMDSEHVIDLFALFKKTYSNPNPPLIHLGGMLGVVNALGAGAGTLFLQFPVASLGTAHNHKESSYIMGPLLASAVLEPCLTSSIQDIFLVAQNSDDHQLQQYAAWAISFLRHYFLSQEVRKERSNMKKENHGSKYASHSFPEDSTVMKLCLWLMHLNYCENGTNPHVNAVSTALRCLSSAPRLPLLEWGAIIRKCMRYEDQVAEIMQAASSLRKGILREQCLLFSLAHANQFDPLLTFLDELSDLPRFRTLEMNLQSSILFHLPDLIKIFSGSRLEKLFDDVANYILSSVSSDQLYGQEQQSLLRTSCWKGLCMCLDETSISSSEYINNIENCMEVLFSLLPGTVDEESILGVTYSYSMEEWYEAVKCLGKARSDWLLDLLQISEVDFAEGSLQFSVAKKNTRARARLFQIGSVPLVELGKVKTYMLNVRSEAIWDVLVEVAAVLQHAEGSVKRQWLLDAVEISCVGRYPSTALQFLGLLSGSFSKYMPLLIVDRLNVLSDLPATLTSLLLEDTSWRVVAESVVSHLWSSTVRIHEWAMHKSGADNVPSQQAIDRSEDDKSVLLLQVMHHACVSLKEFLPPAKQLGLANMVVP